MTYIIAQSLGIIGSMLVILAYYKLTSGKWLNTMRFYITNLAGAVMLSVSLLFEPNIGSIIIELFWISISLVGIHKLKKSRHSN